MAIQDTFPSSVAENREDLSDLIHNIAPTETPGISALRTTRATNVLHQWLVDDLDPPTDTPIAEGDDPAAWDGTPPVRKDNIAQILRKTVQVTGSQEQGDKAGMDSVMAYQSAKQAKVLKTDLDFVIFGTNKAKVAAAAPAATREMASFESWLDNSNRDAGGADPAGADGSAAATDGVVRPLQQSQLDDVIQQCWDDGGRPSLILAGPTQKTAMSGFDGVGNAGTHPFDSTGAGQIGRSDRSSGVVYATMDVYMSNFGRLRVAPSRHIRKTATVDRNVFVIDPEYAKVAYYRSWQQVDLAKTGDNMKRMLLVEATLEMCNKDAHGIIADLGVQT